MEKKSPNKLGAHVIVGLTSNSINCICGWESKTPLGMVGRGRVKKINFLMDEYNAHLKKHVKTQKR